MATHIKCLLGEFLEKKKKEQKVQNQIRQITHKLLGNETSKHIQLKKIFKNQLIFYSDSSSSSYNFELKKAKLLAAIIKRFPEIQDIKTEIQ